MKRNFPLSKVYGLLEPGPVVLITTEHKGRANVMTLSWLTMMEFEPPLVGMALSEANFSFAALKASRQCVMNIPTVELAEAVVGCGNTSGRTLDKFTAFDLTARPARHVTPPLIAECYANLECRVTDARLLKRYNFFILEVLKAWIDPARKSPRTLHHAGKGCFAIDGEMITLPSKKK
ncbi:MAG: flavin reductase family protein [Gammaproteobacteria bacterium]|nr:flavin reductase family protein [Gammaproteobacteria bacterium]